MIKQDDPKLRKPLGQNPPRTDVAQGGHRVAPKRASADSNAEGAK